MRRRVLLGRGRVKRLAGRARAGGGADGGGEVEVQRAGRLQSVVHTHVVQARGQVRGLEHHLLSLRARAGHGGGVVVHEASLRQAGDLGASHDQQCLRAQHVSLLVPHAQPRLRGDGDDAVPPAAGLHVGRRRHSHAGGQPLDRLRAKGAVILHAASRGDGCVRVVAAAGGRRGGGGGHAGAVAGAALEGRRARGGRQREGERVGERRLAEHVVGHAHEPLARQKARAGVHHQRRLRARQRPRGGGERLVAGQRRHVVHAHQQHRVARLPVRPRQVQEERVRRSVHHCPVVRPLVCVEDARVHSGTALARGDGHGGHADPRLEL
mmetsp:Transcript_20613/g.66103  ORF Transcript_20613/g.66103 Transcript_20613/m.66103 type:complete len:324 (-) Transcript_20613:2796-3767(-)